MKLWFPNRSGSAPPPSRTAIAEAAYATHIQTAPSRPRSSADTRACTKKADTVPPKNGVIHQMLAVSRVKSSRQVERAFGTSADLLCGSDLPRRSKLQANVMRERRTQSPRSGKTKLICSGLSATESQMGFNAKGKSPETPKMAVPSVRRSLGMRSVARAK